MGSKARALESPFAPPGIAFLFFLGFSAGFHYLHVSGALALAAAPAGAAGFFLGIGGGLLVAAVCAAADFGFSAVFDTPGEIGANMAAFGAASAVAAIAGFHRRVLSRIEARSRAEFARAESRAREAEEMKALAAHLDKMREEERAKLARDIHDDLGQILTVLKMDLVRLKRNLPQEQGQEVEDAVLAVDRSIEAVRAIAGELRPAMLNDLGLAAAVEWLVKEFGRRTGIECRAEIESDGSEVGHDLALAAYRILQESLTNGVRHAHASEITVRLGVAPAEVRLSVCDNGIGPPPKNQHMPSCLGLVSMRERVAAFGGSFSIGPGPDGGTMLEARFPQPAPAAIAVEAMAEASA
ncbi:MAG: sensor histidine kinase [Nitrospirae bacterium]|nr:sensor histidine kinase [Nitrospirota bacterium]